MARKAKMHAIRKRHGDVVCIMRTKRLAIAAAEILTGLTWLHLTEVDGCRVETVKVDAAPYTPPPGVDLLEPGASELWGQFSRGQRWLTMPRGLMHEMPDDWQSRMSELLDEWDDEWNWPAEFPTARVQAVGKGNRFTSFPPFVLEYKYREKHRSEIEDLRAGPASGAS